MRKVIVACAAACVAASTVCTGASAQPAQGVALDRFNPSERGSEWFALDTLDFRGEIRPAVGVVAEYANRPFVVYNSDGSVNANVVAGQAFAHAGASLVLVDSIRIAANLPVVLLNTGTSGGGFTAPSDAGIGDARVSLDVRLLGRFGTPFSLAAGGQFFVPSGEAKRFTSDDFSRGIFHLAAAGESGSFMYALKVGAQVRGLSTTFNGAIYGHELQFGAAAGVRVADHKLVIGPEIFGATGISKSDAFFKGGSTPLEALLGLHYTIGQDWRIGGAAGPGITYDIGSPRFRAMLSFEWVPHYVPPVGDRDGDGIKDDVDACPHVPGVRTDNPATNGCPRPVAIAPPADRDHDGVPDAEDACPDVPGVRTNDPKTNGCPPDRDHDGVPDAEDACPDTPGVRTNDPKTNGCPPPPSDRDKDGIVDAEDACPDVPGVRTNDPKTNGCPPDPDRDKDGIKNEDDACPDEAGPPDPDPKKNGCPKATIVGTQIQILEQVKFATGSAAILPASDAVLNAVVKILKDHTEIKSVRIEGHTDNVGGAAYNKTLSTQRAASVVAWLVKHGVDKSRLTSQGFGLEKPIDSNATAAGRQNNRRVEFHIESTPATP